MGSFPPILTHLLGQRGLAARENLETFLNPRLRDLSDPFLLPDMEAAVTRIFEAIDKQEHICIYGDYDVDGISSITVMRRILHAYGCEPRHFIPRRSSEGYGLSTAAMERCMQEGPTPDLLITVDCGTASIDEVASLRQQGIEVIIVDHHEPNPRGRPDCHALVNPKCSEGDAFHYLCAAGVTFKLGHAMLKRRPIDFDLKELLEFAAVATIADIVPLIGENRLIVRHGLKRLATTLNPGLQALQEIAGMNGQATSMDVGFRIGPRLNAAGRMDAPEEALATLLTDCKRLAREFAERLDDYNRERQNHETRMRNEALAMLSHSFNPERDPVIVLGSRDWHPGVVGIVASRLMRQFHKPTFIVAIDEEGIGKGSGRSIEGVSLVEAIQKCRDMLLAGGGHDMAAGLSIQEDLLASFRDAFGHFVIGSTSEEQRRPKLYLDAEIHFSLLSLEFLTSYELLQPFGNGNPQPLFLARGVSLNGAPQHLKNQHLRLSLRQGVYHHEAIFFGGGERDLPDPPWDIAFQIDRNTYRGRTSLQLVIQDIRAAE